MRGSPRPSSLAILALTALTVMALGACARLFISPILPPPYRDQVEAPYDATWKALIRALGADNVALPHGAADWGRLRSDPVCRCASTGRWEANLVDAVRRLVKE